MCGSFSRVGCSLVLLLCLGASAASAVTLEIVPTTQIVDPGDDFLVEVVISELGAFSAPSLGAFDVTLSFDPTILSFNAIDFGPFLGDEAEEQAVLGFESVGADLMAFEVSLLLPDELIALQPESFTLFTVTFGATAPGRSPLDILVVDLGDENGDLLEAEVVNGSVDVGEVDDGLCTADSDTLCLRGRRFSVEAEWRDFQGNTGSGRVVPLASDESGNLWFFGPRNWEILVKVLDGCGFNGHFWVFAAATTNVEYNLVVTDLSTGSLTTYFNPLGNDAGTITDTSAFASCSAGAASAVRHVRLDDRPERPGLRVLRRTVEKQEACHPSSTDLCLHQGRFRVEAEFREFSGLMGDAHVVSVTPDETGLLWFFNPTNWEMQVKVLDGCDINGRYWVFSGAATNVEYRLRVTDTQTGVVKEYFNPLGTSNVAITDTRGFDACP